MLIEGKKAGQLKSAGQAKNSDKAVRIPEIGITHRESSQWQQLAKVPEQKFEKAIEVIKECDGVLVLLGSVRSSSW